MLTNKGRRDQARFAFEGPTLLSEAIASRVDIEEIFATETAYEGNADLVELERRGVQIAIVDDRTARKLSDLDTPTGLVAVAPVRFEALAVILASPLSLVLADLNDPGNAGTLLRSAEAFGAGGAIFGRFGVDPYHPKVVRGAMGAIFRLRICVAVPEAVAAAAGEAGTGLYGLTAQGRPLVDIHIRNPAAVVVGHERHGLGTWDEICAPAHRHPHARAHRKPQCGSGRIYRPVRGLPHGSKRLTGRKYRRKTLFLRDVKRVFRAKKSRLPARKVAW